MIVVPGTAGALVDRLRRSGRGRRRSRARAGTSGPAAPGCRRRSARRSRCRSTPVLKAISSKPGEIAVLGGDAVLALQRLHLERRDVVDEVDLALDQRLDRRVLALVDPEDDLVDVRRAVPVVGVGLEAVRRAAGRALDQPERAGADDRLAVRSARPGSSSPPSRSTSFQMCSGTIGIGSSGSTALGFFSVSTTVVSSGAVTVSTVGEVATPSCRPRRRRRGPGCRCRRCRRRSAARRRTTSRRRGC